MSTVIPSPSTTTMRTHLAGELRVQHAGQTVRLGGWVHRPRNLGGIMFLDLRDRTGIVQVSLDPKWSSPEAMQAASEVGLETVITVEGTVAERPPDGRNAELATGEVEVRAVKLRIEGPAVPPAIPVARGRGESLAAEELRLRYRYLDLRRPELQANIILRHALMQATRRYLTELGYLEIETPILTKPTPEGARDYLVPSRVHGGHFYALPQSPQLYKQLLMVSGFDRYFQIARCFRDEDLRADRQPEFTQIDIEASFVGQEDVIAMAEGLVAALWREGGYEVPLPFPRMTYADAMERYGIDRPDTRYGLELFDASDVFRSTDYRVALSAIESGGRVRGIVVPGGTSLSGSQQKELEAVAKRAGAGGLMMVKRSSEGLSGNVAKFLPSGAADALGLRQGDLAVFVAGPEHITSQALDRVRQDVARRLSLIDERARHFLWVTDFPLFAADPVSGALAAVHHPFTSPHPDDLPLLDREPARVRALAYDVVLNGTELGGGSIRISDPQVQSRILGLLGIDEATAQSRFGFLLEGLRAGAPPHGGIAFGFDRIAMLLSGAGSLRDVIAFPKTTSAQALFEGAPSVVPESELEELHVRIVGEAE